MKKEQKNYNGNSFVEALAKIAKEFNQDLDVDFSDTFKNMFPGLQKILDDTKEEVEDTEENTFTNVFKYTSDEIDDVETVAKIMTDKLDELTFKANINKNTTYLATFTFGDKVFKFKWNKDTQHFDGEVNSLDTKFWYNEVERQFVPYDDGDKKELNDSDNALIGDAIPENPGCDRESEESCIECKNNDNGTCKVIDINECEGKKQDDCESCDEQYCGDTCDDCDAGTDANNYEESKFTGESLYNQLNSDRERRIGNVLPAIMKGIDRIFAYDMYTPVRSNENSPINIVVFTLEDVESVCPEKVGKFWDYIEYSRIVDAISIKFKFPRVFIFEKNENGKLVHEVRCSLV